MSTTADRVPLWLVLGATGRLGQALRRARPDVRWVGVARRPPADPQPGQPFVVAARSEVASWAPWLARADAVIDLCAFGPDDGRHLLQAAALAGRWPRLVVAGSIADRPAAAWGLADTAAAPWPPPEDGYGYGKRALAELLTADWAGPLAIARLPRVLVGGLPGERDARWLCAAIASGQAGVGGDGGWQPAWLDAADAAGLLASLAGESMRCGLVTLAKPGSWTAASLVAALAEATSKPIGVVPHASDGPLASGDERLDLSQMQAWWPSWPWRDGHQVWTQWACSVYAAGD